jgi:NTE family protein
MGRVSPRSPEHNSVLFDRLSPDAWSEFERCFEEIRLPAGSTVFEEGDVSDSLYVIETGLVDIVSKRQPGEALAILGAGDSFGEQSLLTGHCRSAAAVARTSVVLNRLGHSDFLALLANVPEVGTAVATVMSDRLRTTSRLAVGVKPGLIVLVTPMIKALASPGTAALDLRSDPVKAAVRLADSCATLRGDAIVLQPSDRPRAARNGTARRGDVRLSPRARRSGRVEIESVATRSLFNAAVRAARDHSVVIVPWTPNHDEDTPTSLFDTRDWHVVLANGTLNPGRRDIVLDAERRVAMMGEDQGDVDAVARLLCRRRVGVALGSGSIRGFAHGGVLSVLANNDVPIDFLAGASAGAIAGSLYLRGRDPQDFANLGLAVRETLRTGLPSPAGISGQAALSGRRLRTFLRNALGADTCFNDLPVPFVVSATDLNERVAVHLDTGSLVDAVSASSAMPGIFPPMKIGGRRLSDGGTTDPVPVTALRERGADIVVAVNVMSISSGPLGTKSSFLPFPFPSLLENLFTGLDTVTAQIAVESCRLADIEVTPVAPATKWYQFIPTRAYEAAGERAMTDALPEILAFVGRS